MKLTDIIDSKKTKLDTHGIWTTDVNTKEELKTSQKAWERIYNFNQETLKKDREDFNTNKLDDHMRYIERTYNFSDTTVYLEIGCGPSYIGEHLMKKYNCYFIGVDFNYDVLRTLKKYFDQKGYKRYLLIHADINTMPIKPNSIDYIYGGGVIEHFRNTEHILKHLYTILKKGGVCFNTIPAFNSMWLLRFWNNIPSLPLIRGLFEFIHIMILKNKMLETYHGYELSYTKRDLYNLHKKAKFKEITIGAFAFHPSEKKMKNKLLRNIYYSFTSHSFTSPVYFVSASK